MVEWPASLPLSAHGVGVTELLSAIWAFPRNASLGLFTTKEKKGTRRKRPSRSTRRSLVDRISLPHTLQRSKEKTLPRTKRVPPKSPPSPPILA